MCQSIYTLLEVSRFGPLISKCTNITALCYSLGKRETNKWRLFVTETILIS